MKCSINTSKKGKYYAIATDHICLLSLIIFNDLQVQCLFNQPPIIGLWRLSLIYIWPLWKWKSLCRVGGWNRWARGPQWDGFLGLNAQILKAGSKCPSQRPSQSRSIQWGSFPPCGAVPSSSGLFVSCDHRRVHSEEPCLACPRMEPHSLLLVLLCPGHARPCC